MLLSLTSRAQNPLFFDKYFPTGFNNLASTNVLFVPQDSSYVVLNYVRDSVTNIQNPNFLKLDKFGNQTTSKTYYFGFDYLAYLNGTTHFIDATPNTFFVTGTTYTSTNTTIILNKINKFSLDTLKTTFYYDGLFDYYLSNIIKISSNKFYLIGNKSNTTTTWPVFIEIDSNIVVQNVITSPTTYSISTKSACYDTLNKKIVLSGWKYGSNDSYSFIAITDTLANFLDTFINTTCNHAIAKLIYNKINNSYYTIGSKKTSIYGNTAMNRIHITNYDTNLNLLWQKTYGSANMVNTFRNVLINNNGDLILIGSYSDSLNLPIININTNAFILKVKANGDSLWMREFDNINDTSHSFNTYFEGLYGIEKTPEGGYIMCGNAQNQPNAKAWVVKTDSMGCVLSNCSSTGLVSSSVDENSFSVYPNPATHKITIEIPLFDSAQNDKLSVIMTNAIGEVVQTKRLTQQATEINISQLSSGLYFVNLVNQNGNITTKKVVVIK